METKKEKDTIVLSKKTVQGGSKMRKKVLSVILAACMVGGMLAGCGGNSQSTKENGSDANEKVTLRFSWWGGDERNEATLKVIDNFEKEHPNITIEPEYSGDDGYLEKLSTALAGNQAADIIQNGPGWMPSFVEKGDFFIDFNDYKDKIDMSGFSEDYLKNTCTFDDKLLGLPTGIGATTLLVNKTLADEIGLDFSKTVTWEGLLEMGKEVQAYNSDMYLMNIDTSFMLTNVLRPYVMQLTGKPIVDDDTKALSCTDKQMTQALTYIEDLYDTKTVQAASETASFNGSPQTNPKWINGQVVCTMTNSSQINNLTSANENTEYIVVNMPVMGDSSVQKNDGYYANPPQLMCINKNSKYIDEALEFLDYFYNNDQSAETLKDLRGVPVTENARNICEEKGLISELTVDSVNMALEKNGVNEMGLTTDSEVESALNTMIEEVSYGQSTPDQASKEGIDMINNVLAEKQ